MTAWAWFERMSLPANVGAFVDSATIRRQEYDKVMKRDEMLYF